VRKSIISLGTAIVLALAIGYWVSVQADDPACVTCDIDYYTFQGKCYIAGDNCLPNQGEPGQYYIVYKPESVEDWGQILLDSKMLICEDDCNGYTFRKEIECDDYVDYFFMWDPEVGDNEYYCGDYNTPSRAYRTL